MKLFELLDKQLTRLQQKFPQEQVVRDSRFLQTFLGSLIVCRAISYSLVDSEILPTSNDAFENATRAATHLFKILDLSKSA